MMSCPGVLHGCMVGYTSLLGAHDLGERAQSMRECLEVVLAKLGEPLVHDASAPLAQVAQPLFAARRDAEEHAPAVAGAGLAPDVAAAHQLIDEQAGGGLTDGGR